MAKIVESPKDCPEGCKWRTNKGKPDYMVKWWRGLAPAKYSHHNNLTTARAEASALIREDSATVVEIYRYASGGHIQNIPIIQASYYA